MPVNFDQSQWSRYQQWSNRPKACGQEALLWNKRHQLTGLPPYNLTCLHKKRQKKGKPSRFHFQNIHTNKLPQRGPIQSNMKITSNTWIRAVHLPHFTVISNWISLRTLKSVTHDPFTLLDKYKVQRELPPSKDEWYTENTKFGNYVDSAGCPTFWHLWAMLEEIVLGHS